MNDLTINDIALPKQVEEALEAAYGNGDHMNAGATTMPFQPKFWAKVALLAITKEPVVPSDEDVRTILGRHMDKWEEVRFGREAFAQRIAQFSRFCFLRKPDPVPDEVKAILERCGWQATVNGHTTALGGMALELVELGKRLGADTRAK